MTEADAIAAQGAPVTVDSLVADLRALGVEPGGTLLVHSSLSRLGWVSGGAHAVVLALLKVVGEDGTLVMPTHSGSLSDPKGWVNPPVPPSWWEDIRDSMPAYDPALTPTRVMGAIVECFRHVPGVIRSDHPSDSFAACGPNAEAIVAGHQLAFGLGDHSPLARIYDAGGRVLLLGVGHANNTSLHLAESRATWPSRTVVHRGAPLVVDGVRRWVDYESLDWNADDFEDIGAAFAATGAERSGSAGAGQARLMSQRAVVDFALDWIERSRT